MIDLNTISGTRLLRKKDILEIFGFSTTTLWRHIKAGRISPGIQIGYKQKAWTAEEIRNLYNGVVSGEIKLYAEKKS